jgi:hypothetical protein
MSTPPRRRNNAWNDVQTGSKLLEDIGRQSFGKNISKLTACWNMEHLGLTERHAISNEVEINLDVFRPLMLEWV